MIFCFGSSELYYHVAEEICMDIIIAIVDGTCVWVPFKLATFMSSTIEISLGMQGYACEAQQFCCITKNLASSSGHPRRNIG